MSRWWTGMAVVAGCLAQCGLAEAQQQQPSIPTPYGASRTPPEPLPIGACPAPVPNLIPGPLTPDKAPPGPADCFDLPAGIPGAFQCETFPPEFAVYFDTGAQALQRQKLGKGGIAVTDINNQNPTAKTGVIPAADSPIAQRFNDITPNMAFGPSGTIGVLCGSDAIELTGYWIPTNSHMVSTTQPGRIGAFFYNAPPGFGGYNGIGLFTQDDYIGSTLQSEIGNVELNYRYHDLGLNGLELILGVRYFDVQERLSTFVDQNAVLSPNDTVDSALYAADTHNRIIAPQFGFEGNWGLCSWLSMGALAKGAWGVNFVSDEHSLVRGDGFSGFNVSRSSTTFSQIYEIGAFAEIHITERMRVRAGYNAIWILNVDSVVDQYDFNLAQPQGPINHDGSVLYHGPTVQVEFLF